MLLNGQIDEINYDSLIVHINMDGDIIHYEKMDLFISTIEKIIKKNPFILGACCGSSSNHIKELIKLRNKIHLVPNI